MLSTTFHYAATRRITEIGLLVALLGGLVVALGSRTQAGARCSSIAHGAGLARAPSLRARVRRQPASRQDHPWCRVRSPRSSPARDTRPAARLPCASATAAPHPG